MKVRCTRHDGKYVIYPVGRITPKAAGKVKSFMTSLLETEGYCYTLDLKNVTHIDSSGLGTLHSINTLLAQQGRSFQIRNIVAV
jgi:anti-anti-sigma factor